MRACRSTCRNTGRRAYVHRWTSHDVSGKRHTVVRHISHQDLFFHKSSLMNGVFDDLTIGEEVAPLATLACACVVMSAFWCTRPALCDLLLRWRILRPSVPSGQLPLSDPRKAKRVGSDPASARFRRALPRKW